MKLTPYLALLALAVYVPAVSAEEMQSTENEAMMYCKEQAELSGVEEAAEKQAIYQECIDSMNLSPEAGQPTGE